ncbi:DNA methyltransferase [Pseudobutyrivibrio ruminis]|uniref:DNA methyltransferase n=1 Tax=Pseudobutyrivibrio ruminis TaxID=46206 RepID=UPI0004154C73|nr:DNA methyltransferase [Pseudobutyrivibrio ruminis]
MKNRNLTRADIDAVRKYEGFPKATDEDIINLSEAPYYTACPNPFIEEFLSEYGHKYDEDNDSYQKEPFAADVSEGKNDPIYMAHTYHTKVPYKAIMRYILHYTKPGDIVFDGFCGTGMTGVAAHRCGNEKEVFELSPSERNNSGERYAILNDISPAATFIANGYNSPFSMKEFHDEFNEIMEDVKRECDYLYTTKHEDSFGFLDNQYGTINYTIWSDVFICPHCGKEIVFWDAAVDLEAKKINDEFACPNCGMELKKATCDRAIEKILDSTGEVINFGKQVPVQINYTFGGKRYNKRPDDEDLKMINNLTYSSINGWFPQNRMCEGSEGRRNDISGITHTHHFMTPRNLMIFSRIFNHPKMRLSRIVFTSIMMNCTKTYRYRTNGKGGALSGTLYIPSLYQENNIFDAAIRKFKDFALRDNGSGTIISCGSATQLPIPDNSVDYIFTDPPFGSNLNYSELSYVWESWLKVMTNQDKEAIINAAQNKGLPEYQNLMTKCFSEFFRVLKPNRWITIEFHNSKNSVWNAIQEAIQRAGFVIADVRTLNKQQSSYKQLMSQGAVKQDLVISAYKPKKSFTDNLLLDAGTEETAWSFVRQHLANLPVIVDSDGNGKIDIIDERQAYLLFDRMVAYHIMKGIPIPMDAHEFYVGLGEHFIERDSMYFLADQVNEYDTARIKMDVEPVQLSFVVTNEKTAIGWLYQQLNEPQAYADIQPKFMREVKSVDKYEAIPELAELLEENFLQDDSGKWYIPDITKEGDLSKLREKKLIKEFEGYMQTKGKLKLFRSEAIRAGFSMLWKDKNYQAIVDMAQRLPDTTIQEDQNLLMYYDISLSRI